MKTTFFNNTDRYSSLSAINQGLHEWVTDKNNTLHRSTGKSPVELFKEETIKLLPAIPWKNVNIHPPVNPTFAIRGVREPEVLINQ